MPLRTWWKSWGELVLKFLAIAGSLASVMGILVPFFSPPEQLPWWFIVLIVVAIFALACLVFLEFLSHRRRHVYSKDDRKGIKKYMHDWIEHGGRVAIWTRDMSWADNKDTRELLREKAVKNELILCLPEENELATELRDAGAEICAYGANRLESPASRFTITFFGRDGARVAVGTADGDVHLIDEFSSRSHPAFYLAADLVALVRAIDAGQH